MASRIQKDLEIVLLGIQIPSLNGKAQSSHGVNCSLIWPRFGIARKNAQLQLDFANGAVNLENSCWCRKILFKEAVEWNFGLQIQVSEALSRSQLTNFGKFAAAQLLDFGADEIEDKVPGGNLASIPLEYLSKSLKKAADPEVLVSGTLDLDSHQFDGEHSALFEIPLFTEKEQARRRRIGGAKGHIRYAKEILLPKGQPDGIARVSIRCFDK